MERYDVQELCISGDVQSKLWRTYLYTFTFHRRKKETETGFKQGERENVKRTCRGASRYNTFNFPKKGEGIKSNANSGQLQPEETVSALRKI